MYDSLTPEQRYESLVESMLVAPSSVHIGDGPTFGSTGRLKIGGRSFAMLVNGRLVVKLPSRRIDELIRAGSGERFDAGKGKPMREWFALSPSSDDYWPALAMEAMEFVSEIG
ncbi:MAG: hypothetical protein ACHQ0J_05175 [Candidatus Dormibacterales bacterium]